MTLSLQLERLEVLCLRVLDRLAAEPRLAGAALVALALLTYLPGVLLLPPVDRTEVVYAEMAREMARHGHVLDAQFNGERYAYRPIGITWLQMAPARILGSDAQKAIATYRLPSLIGGALAVLAVWGLLRTPLGERRALIAAALFAVSPIVALQASLAIPEGPLLLAIAVAQLSLLRLYCDPAHRRASELALLFWAAQGFAILINALAVPLLTLSTIAALFVLDRDLSWLKRLRPLIGIPLMLVIAAPWLIVRAHVDGGIPFATLTWSEIVRALGGAQDMKWKAAPLTFTVALILGFMPGAQLWVPAARNLWEKRGEALPRFLFSWLVGYLAYLELFSSEPAIYTVQAMFPAAAIAAVLVLDRDGRLALPDYMLRMPAWLAGLAVAALIAAVLWIAATPPDAAILIGTLLITALFMVSAQAARDKLAAAWIVTACIGFALFVGFTFGVLLPRLEKGWPASRIAEAVAPLEHCVVGPVGVLGFREPSAVFVIGRDNVTTPDAMAARMAGGEEGIAVIEDRWHPELMEGLEARGARLPPRIGCLEAFNVMRGCPVSFSIYITGAPRLGPECKVAPHHQCKGPLPPAGPPTRCK
jgi:4-amino-4-deoxy-L-arabinose transferase-like glycosyltransferase